MSAPLAARDAALTILAHLRRQPALRVPLDDALEAVLAEDIVAPLDIPAWANSAMDGYAARSADVRGATAAAPVRLAVIEEIAAGQFPTRPLAPGQCSRIFTGAPVPAGADCVIRQEDTDGGRAEVTITSDRDAGGNIRQAGEDVRKGATILTAGSTLGPAALGLLASVAVATPMIYRRPRVAIFGGGDELVDVDQPDEILAGRKIASSNTHTLMALVRQAGGVPVNLGIARDTRASVREHFERALASDLIVSSAGVSVGEHDHVRGVLEEMGAELLFWRVRMRPGAPVGFGPLGGVPWIGLPGNPVSTMVTFELFVRPAIRALLGQPLPFRRATPVTVSAPITLGPRLQHFLRAVVDEAPAAGGPRPARLTGPQGSGILTSMVLANALLVIPEGQQQVPAGSPAQALLLDDPAHQAAPPF